MGIRDWFKAKGRPSEPPPPIEPSNDLEREHLREGARMTAGIVLDSLQAMNKHSQNLHLWMLASLLTLNGGAAIAVASSSRLSLEEASAPLAGFLAGCVLALVTALISAISAAPIARRFGPALDHLLLASRTGVISSEAQVAVENVSKFAYRRSTIALAVGLLSLCAFSFGAISLLHNARATGGGPSYASNVGHSTELTPPSS
jgi:uncharacterized protein (DUF1810 family)